MVSKQQIRSRFFPKAKAIITEEFKSRRPTLPNKWADSKRLGYQLTSLMTCLTSKRVIDRLIDAFLDSMIEELVEKERLDLPGFAVVKIGRWSDGRTFLRARKLKRLKDGLKKAA